MNVILAELTFATDRLVAAFRHAAFASPVCDALVSAANGRLVASLFGAAFSTAMTNALSRPASRRLVAAFLRAPFSPSVCDAERGGPCRSFLAAFVRAPFPSTVGDAKGRLALRRFLAACLAAAFPAPVPNAELYRRACGSLGASLDRAAHSTAMRFAVLAAVSGQRRAAVYGTVAATPVLSAQVGALHQFVAALGFASPAPAVGFAKLRGALAHFVAVGSSASLAATVCHAQLQTILNGTHGRFWAVGIRAPPATSVGDAMFRGALRGVQDTSSHHLDRANQDTSPPPTPAHNHTPHT